MDIVNFIISSPQGKFLCSQASRGDNVASLRSRMLCCQGLQTEDFYLVCNSRIVEDYEELKNGCIYHVTPRLPGGKGGFGSMLRAIGAQIEKTTNREACRDLSGRRMRDVNNEKKLRDWVNKKAEREREKDERRQARLERLKHGPRHQFDDPTYERQKMQVAENLEEALQKGLQSSALPGPSGASTSAAASAATSSASTDVPCRKRKATLASPGSIKKARAWMGVDIENISDLDSDSDESTDDTSSPPPETSSPKVEQDSGHETPASSNQSDAGKDSDSGVDSVTVKKTTDSEQVPSIAESMEIDSFSPKAEDTMQTDFAQSSEAAASSETVPVTQLGDSHQTHGLLSALASTPPSQKTAAQQPAGNKEIDLQQYSCASELEAEGLEALKTTLMSLGLKCGGTLQQRAERLFSIKGLSSDQYPPVLRAKPAKGKKAIN